jgi:hypothetical protein
MVSDWYPTPTTRGATGANPVSVNDHAEEPARTDTRDVILRF